MSEEEKFNKMEGKRENKKLNKKIVVLCTGASILLIILLVAIVIFKNWITMENVIEGLKENIRIGEKLQISNESSEWKNPFENEDILVERKVFYDTRLSNYKEKFCVIYILENEQYATLLKEYLDGITIVRKQILKDMFNMDRENDVTIHQNKNCLICLDNNLGSKIKIYIEQFDKLINKGIYIPKNKINEEEYVRLSNIMKEKISDYEMVAINMFEDAAKQWAEEMTKKIDDLEESLNEMTLQNIKKELEEMAKMKYFKELIIEWNERIDAIEKEIIKLKEDKATNITNELNNLANSLNEDELANIEEEISKISDTYYDTYKKSWNIQIQDIKVNIEQKKITDYKASCKNFTFEEISRSPETYKGEKAHFIGEIVQVMEGGYGYVALRVNITKKGTYSTYYTDTIYVIYYENDTNNRLLEDDIIDIYGELDGLYSYTSVMGATITLPRIKAQYIDIK